MTNREPRFTTRVIVEPCYCNKLRQKKNCVHACYHYHGNKTICSGCGEEFTVRGLD